MLPLCGTHIDKNRLLQLKPSSGVQPDLSKETLYNRTSSVTEMVQSLDLDLLEDRHKAHRLNILYLAVNNSIALSIPNYFLPKQYYDYYFYNFYPRTIRDWNSLLSGIHTSTNFSLFKDLCFLAIRNN